MKILALNYRDRKHPAAGGAEKHFHQIFSRLVSKGHQVVLLTTAFAQAPTREIVDGIEVVRVGGDLTFQWNVAKLLPKLDKEYNFDVIYEDLNKLPLFTPLLSKKPKLIQIHHLWGKSIFAEALFPIALAVWLFERFIPLFYKREKFVAVSPSTVSELKKLGIPVAQIALIYNGADKMEMPTHEVSESSYFVWLSRLHRYKGIFTALRAFQIFVKKHPNVRLKIAGSGPLLKKMPKILKKMKLESNVDVEGFVSSQRKAELFANALALLQTSEKEGWGLTVIEAGSLKTPTIASEAPGLCDSVLHRQTGFLFPKRDAQKLAEFMETLYENPEQRQRMGEAALAYAETFSWARAADETEFLLQELISKNATWNESEKSQEEILISEQQNHSRREKGK